VNAWRLKASVLVVSSSAKSTFQQKALFYTHASVMVAHSLAGHTA
jgi:hypothetical protein